VPVGGRGVDGGGALLIALPTGAGWTTAAPTSSGVGGGLGILSGSTTGSIVFDGLIVDVGTPAVLSSLGGSA
jgi:hypothetical protein